jgi:hypothetical protein
MSVFNKNSLRAHMELELDVLGVHGKLVKYVGHSSKRKNWKRINFLHTSCLNNNRSIFQGILGVKRFQVSFVFYFLSFILFYIILKCMCVNFLQCWWEWVLNGVKQHTNTQWSTCGLERKAFSNLEWICTRKSIIESYGWSNLKSIYFQTMIIFLLQDFQG